MHKITISYSMLLFSIVFHMQATETNTALLDIPYNNLSHLNIGPFAAPLECYNAPYYKRTWTEIINLLPSNLHENYSFPSLTRSPDLESAEAEYRLYLTSPTIICLQNLQKKQILLLNFYKLKAAIDENKDYLSIKKSSDFMYKAPTFTYNDYLKATIKYSSELVQHITQPISNKFNQYNPCAKDYDEIITAPPCLIYQQSTAPDLTEDFQNNRPLTSEQFITITNFFNNLNSMDQKINEKITRLNNFNQSLGEIPCYPIIWEELEKLSKEMVSPNINYQAIINDLAQKYDHLITHKDSTSSRDNAHREIELLQSTTTMYPYVDSQNRTRINISHTLTPKDKCITIQRVINDRMLTVNRILNK